MPKALGFTFTLSFTQVVKEFPKTNRNGKVTDRMRFKCKILNI